MIDVKYPVRKAYYDLLNTGLMYNGNMVPVGDDAKRLGDASTVYVLLSNQTGAPASSFQTFDSFETIVLDIVYKSGSRVNKQVVDTIAAQIIPLVVTGPGSNGLISDPSIQINCVELFADTYLTMALNSSNSVMRRLLTFKQRVRQTGVSGPIPSPPIFRNPIISSDFSDSTQYVNEALKGRSFLLYLNGVGFLKDTDFSILVDGGFEIFLNNFDATQNSYTFFLLLQ